MSKPNRLKIKVVGLVLFLILLLAGILRLYHLGSYPPLNADEAAIGYNAWSLLETGKDEHGDSWPIHFKSFGDYKPGAYFYIVIPFVKLFGLSEWPVRLPSALAGMATVYLVFLLSKLIWNNTVLGLVWALVLSISPWHIHFSRGGWESNFSVFLMVFGVYLFFKFKSRILEARKADRNLSLIILSVFCFVLAMYTYHSARIIAPVLVLGLLISNWRFVWRNIGRLVFPVFFGFLLLVPLVISFLSGGASARFSGVGLFADSGPLWRVNELLNQHQGKGFPFVRLLHNKPIIYSISFAQKYLSHFDGRFLFVEGDEVPRSKLPDMGVMHLFEFIFLALGVYFWLREKREERCLPFIWLIVAPIASAMTFQAPSALRALSMVIPLTFFVAVGVVHFIDLLADWQVNRLIKTCKPLNLLAISLTALFYLWGLFYWQDRYFNHYLKRFPSACPGGFKELVSWFKEKGKRYQKIYITDKYDQPYILMLFYSKYSALEIQKEIKLTPPDNFGFSTVRNFGKYCFGLGRCDQWQQEFGTLVVAAPGEPVNGKLVKEIYTGERNLAFRIFEQ